MQPHTDWTPEMDVDYSEDYLPPSPVVDCNNPSAAELEECEELWLWELHEIMDNAGFDKFAYVLESVIKLVPQSKFIFLFNPLKSKE